MKSLHAVLMAAVWIIPQCCAAGFFLNRARSIATIYSQAVNSTLALEHRLIDAPLGLDSLHSPLGLDDDPKLRFFWTIALSSYTCSLLFVYGVWWWFVKDKSGKRRIDRKRSRKFSSTYTDDTITIATGSSTADMETVQAYDSDDSSSDDDNDDMTPHSRSQSRMSVLSGKTGTEVQVQKMYARDTWATETMPERLQIAALALMLIGCLMVVYMAMRFLSRPECAPFEPRVHVPEMLALGCLMTLVFLCVKNPSQELYWPTLMLWLLYIPAAQLPPFNLSCTMLEEVCHNSDHWRVVQAVSHADCSLQGQTAQQIFLTVFLLLPWLLPERRMLHLMWVWIGSVYLLWSVAYIRYSPDGKMGFGSYDILLRSILLAFALVIAFAKKHFLEKSQRARFRSDRENNENSKNLYNILEYMLPEHVISTLLMMKPGEPWSQSLDEVTILFLLIDDFESIVRKYQTRPSKLLEFLNITFTQIDKICSLNDVTKIETVGEEYVACVGVTPADVEDGKILGHGVLLERLFQAASDILALQSSTVKFKMGVHTGPIVAGVVGHKLPRFRLFGDTINTSARMMQKGVVGQVQFGAETKKRMPAEVQYVRRGTVEMKGKGQVETFLFTGNPRDAEAASDPPTRSAEETTGKKVGFEEAEHARVDTVGSVCLSGCSKIENPRASTGLLGYLRQHTIVASAAEEVLPPPQAPPGRKKSGSGASKCTKDFGSVVKKMQENMEDVAAERAIESGADRRRFETKMVSEKCGFTPEMEKAWFHEYMDDILCRKLHPRIDKWILGLFIISIVELLWNTPDPHHPELSGWDKPHANFGTQWRVSLFIGARVCILSMLVGLRAAAASPDWIWENPTLFQSAYVGVASSCILVLYFSYHVMIVGHTVESHGRLVAPPDQIFSLGFVLLFFIIIRDRMLFFYSLAYIPLALLITILSNIRSESGVYFPLMGQVLFVIIAISNSVLSHSEEQSSRARFKAKHAMEATRDRVQHILKNMIPPAVLKQIQDSPAEGVLPSHQYEAATLCQSDLCGFTLFASCRTPAEVVGFISEIFGLFDDLSRQQKIYKIETVGDAYIAGQAEMPLTSHNSPTEVVKFGMGMVIAVNEWSKRTGHSGVRCRVGVNHGPCLGGIVGAEMQRYHIFGSLMQGLEILESTAPECGVQISKSCREACETEWLENQEHEPLLKFCQRSAEQLTTSKGEVHTYDEVGGPTHVVLDKLLSADT